MYRNHKMYGRKKLAKNVTSPSRTLFMGEMRSEDRYSGRWTNEFLRMNFINSIPSCKYNKGYKPLQIKRNSIYPKYFILLLRTLLTH